MSPEIIDLFRVSLERTAQAIKRVPDKDVYWRNEAAYAHERMTSTLNSIESGELPCCDYAAVASDLQAVKRFADRLPEEVTMPQATMNGPSEETVVMHRSPMEPD